MAHSNPSDDDLRRLLSTSRTIAMVGALSKADRHKCIGVTVSTLKVRAGDAP